MTWLPVTNAAHLPTNDAEPEDLAAAYHRERASLEAEAMIAAMMAGITDAAGRAAMLWRVRDESERLYARVMQAD